MPRQKGLRWAVAELGRTFQNRKVMDVRKELDADSVMGIGEELPLIVAMQPRWVISMDGGKIPFVDALDIEVRPEADGEFGYAPYFYFGQVSGQVNLRAEDVGDRSPSYGAGFLR